MVIRSPENFINILSSVLQDITIISLLLPLFRAENYRKTRPSSLLLSLRSLAFLLVFEAFPSPLLWDPSSFWVSWVLTDFSCHRSGMDVGSSLFHLRAAVAVHRPCAHVHQHYKYRQRVGTEWELEPRKPGSSIGSPMDSLRRYLLCLPPVLGVWPLAFMQPL